MRPQHFFDTNILLYSIDTNASELDKRERAIELLNEDRGAISIQILQEFYVQATRPSRSGAATHEDALSLIKGWTRLTIQDMTLSVFNTALEIKKSFGFSYWDSAIIAAACELGCETLYSEDMTHGQRVSGVLIVNPFR